jgi:hypothetical protein
MPKGAAKRAAKKRKAARKPTDLVGKRLQFDRETWNAVDLMARDQMKSVEEITEEAFRDLLKKHGRSADFREQLKLSVRAAKRERPGAGISRAPARKRG